MKKFISLILATSLILLCSVNIFADDTDTHKVSAQNQLQKIFKLYDEFDYTEENWQLMTESYANGISAIDSATTPDSVYDALNYAAEDLISINHKYRSITACISVENLVTEKGFIIFPEYIKIPKYQSVAQTLVDLLDEKFDVRDAYYINGSVEHNFELTAVYQGVSTTIDDPTEISTANYLRTHLGSWLPEPADKTYLQAGNYTSESCFVYSVNNEFPDVKASGIPVLEEDVIRWQFSVYGKGADVGANSYYSQSPIISPADKSELYWMLADIVIHNDMELLLSNDTNKKYFNDGLTVALIANISQKAVDKAIDKLEKIEPITSPPEEAPPEPETDNKFPEQPDISEPSEPSEPSKPEASVQFTDLNETHFAKEAVDFLSTKGVIGGRPDGSFGTNDPITRAEFAAIIARYEGYSEAAELPFTDIKSDDWFASGVSFCYVNGITTGQTDEIFNPHAYITRQDIATMLYRYAKYKEINFSTNEIEPFADENLIAGYAVDAVNALKSAGLISGRDNNAFAPIDNASRAETAKMFYNLIK